MIIQSNCTKYLKKRAQIFFDKLQQLADFIAIWMDCQIKWIYLSSVFVEFALLGTHVSYGDIFKELNINYQSLVNTLFDNIKTLHLIGVRVVDNFQLHEESNYLIGRLLTVQRELSKAMTVILYNIIFINILYVNIYIYIVLTNTIYQSICRVF